jgi:hypothetical protein
MAAVLVPVAASQIRTVPSSLAVASQVPTSGAWVTSCCGESVEVWLDDQIPTSQRWDQILGASNRHLCRDGFGDLAAGAGLPLEGSCAGSSSKPTQVWRTSKSR